MDLPDNLKKEFEELVAKYQERRAGLIPALHRCQEELGGWISPEIIDAVAEFFELEPVEVWGVVSFYPMFHTEPVGKHVISICRNISCDLRGADRIVARVCEKTGAKPGATSADGRYTIELVECQGACANAPMMDVDGVYHEDLDQAKVDQILEELS